MISESSKRSTAKVPSHEIAWVMCITRPTSLQSKSIKKLSTVTVVFHSSILPDYFGHIECVWVFEYICSLNPVVQYCLSAYLPLFTCILTCIIPNVCPTRWVGYAHTHTHGWYQMRQLGTSPYKHAVPASSPHSATQIHGESEPWTNSRSRYSLFPWRWYHKCTGNISVVAIVKPETTDIPFFTEATHRSLMLWTDASILLTLTDVRTSELLQVHALRTAAKSSDRARSRFGKTPHWIELIES